MDVAIVADTHIPSREQVIPEQFRERIETADHVIHVGDFDTKGALADFKELAGEWTAVHGNMDPADLGLPSVATVAVGGVTFAVTHGTVRSVEAWLETVAETAKAEASEPRVGVGGHIHQVVDEEHGGERLLNPGSATGAAPADRATMLTVTVTDGDIDVTVHEA